MLIKYLKPTPTDSELIKKVIKGSEKAFKILYDRYARLHLLTCIRYVKNRFDAEDLLQEAYMTIYKDLKQFDSDKGNFSQWSNRVVVNICLQKLRKKKMLVYVDNLIQFNAHSNLNVDALGNLNLQDLTEKITALPNGYRTVFNMYVIDGFTHKEIAEVLKISESTSKTQLMKAKRMLQKSISLNENQLKRPYD